MHLGGHLAPADRLLGQDRHARPGDLGEAAQDHELVVPPAWTTRSTPGRRVVMVGTCPAIAVMSPSVPGICTSRAWTEDSLRSGLTRSNCIASPWDQAAAAAMRSALAITSLMPPTM
jgi:hypothetical protein